MTATNAAAVLDALHKRVVEMREAAYTYGEYSQEAVTIALDGVVDAIDEIGAAPEVPAQPAAPQSDLAGAQFAAKQHLATVQAQAERIAALEAKCDLLAASLKQADGRAERLVEALKDCVSVMEAELNGLAVIQPELRQARAALVEVGAA